MQNDSVVAAGLQTVRALSAMCLSRPRDRIAGVCLSTKLPFGKLDSKIAQRVLVFPGAQIPKIREQVSGLDIDDEMLIQCSKELPILTQLPTGDRELLAACSVFTQQNTNT